MIGICIAAVVCFGIGWFAHRAIWPICGHERCALKRRCPVHEAAEIRAEQASAGPLTLGKVR